jgi:glutamine amidotransferase
MVVIVNYGSGNIQAIANIYDSLKVDYRIATSVQNLTNATKIILPGVGAFDQTMGKLESSGFVEKLNKLVLVDKVPILGICVGMQVLANGSEEGTKRGLGWIKGQVKKFDKDLIESKPKIPHLGWNSISLIKDSSLFCNVNQNDGFYFIHSYYFETDSKDDILTESFYGKKFSSSVNRENIYGVQFHPEKSHKNGINLLKNFSEL